MAPHVCDLSGVAVLYVILTASESADHHGTPNARSLRLSRHRYKGSAPFVLDSCGLLLCPLLTLILITTTCHPGRCAEGEEA